MDLPSRCVDLHSRPRVYELVHGLVLAVGLGHEERVGSIDARADREPVARDDAVEVLPAVEGPCPKRLERVSAPSHVRFVDEPVRALGVAVRDAAGAFPVVEDELAVVLDGPSKGSERIELPAIGNFPNPGVERRLSLLA